MTAARPAREAPSPGAPELSISAVNPLDFAQEIKQLFLTHERPEFPDFFDRTYPRAVAHGATSWVGRDPRGQVVMHIACLPRRFTFGNRQVVAGLLANLVVAKAYRSFFPAVALVSRLVKDSQEAGVIDFLYADPNEESRALMRGIRFARFGTLQRYVLPVRDPRRFMDAGVRLFHALMRVVSWRRAGRGGGIPHAAARFSADAYSVPGGGFPRDRLAAYHDRSLYVSRLKGYPGDRDWWFACPEVALLLRGPGEDGLAALHALRWASPMPLAAVLPGLIDELRRRGCERLQVVTVAESALGRTFQRCGFVARSETVPLFALPLSALGEECVRAVRDWEITDLDCDR
jgi:hypothetical protein